MSEHESRIVATMKHFVIGQSLSDGAYSDRRQHGVDAQPPREQHMTDLSTLSKNQLIAMVASMQSAPRKLSMKVSPKGVLSVYGLGRFPVTLYRDQWERLATEMDTAFITANSATFTVKA